MSDGDNVIFLAFSNNEQVAEDGGMMACRHCRNKTFTHNYDSSDKFPLVKCAACGSHIGRCGWADNDEEE